MYLPILQSSSVHSTFFFQDEVTVNVIELSGVRIHSALSRMQTGTKVSIHWQPPAMLVYP